MLGMLDAEDEGCSTVAAVHSGWQSASKGGRDESESIGGVMEQRGSEPYIEESLYCWSTNAGGEG